MGFGAFGAEAQQTDDVTRSLSGPGDVQRFICQEGALRAQAAMRERARDSFQLESLILAQNERWRQA